MQWKHIVYLVKERVALSVSYHKPSHAVEPHASRATGSECLCHSEAHASAHFFLDQDEIEPYNSAQICTMQKSTFTEAHVFSTHVH